MKRRRRELVVNFVNRNHATASGHGSREMLMSLRRGRAPVWSSVSSAWSTTPETARDLIALAESRGYVVTVADDDPLPTSRGRLF